VTEQVLEGLAGEEALDAARRSRGWRLFDVAFSYPDAELLEAIRSGELAEAFREGLGEVDPGLVAGADVAALCDGGPDDDALAVEYTRLFDVGASGPPCPLYGGLYGGARTKVMEEAVRFYNHFGLTLADAPRELPDHLSTELEFLHFLAFREAEALARGEDPGPWRRAQRDFVARHPGKWVPKLRERLDRQAPLPYFREVVRLLERFLAQEQRHLVRLAGPVPEGSGAAQDARPA
jgi:DMSO reductase family type II enzyme chaperone